MYQSTSRASAANVWSRHNFPARSVHAHSVWHGATFDTRSSGKPGVYSVTRHARGRKGDFSTFSCTESV